MPEKAIKKFNPEQQLDRLITWTRKVSQPTDGLLVPVSGGTDSALAFWVSNQARPGEVLGVHTRPAAVTVFDQQVLGVQAETSLRGQAWFEQVGQGNLQMIDTPGESDEVEEMRWGRFLNMAVTTNTMLVGSRTRTEDLLGTYSLASRVATAQPLVGTWKSDVIELCRFVGVPEDVIESSYQADCACGRPQRMSCIPFGARDDFLRSYVLGEEVDLSSMPEADQSYLKGVVDYNRFKGDLPFRGPAI